jgi:ADP-heptose:LPS heptosyltransferase
LNLLVIDFLIKRKKVEINPGTLLVIRLDSIGDYIMFRNFLRLLKENDRFKKYKITLCGNIAFRELAETFDKEIISDFIWINRDLFLNKLSYKYRTLEKILKKGFEVVIDTIHSREILFGDIIVKSSGAKEKIGSQVIEKSSKFRKRIFSDSFYTRLIPANENSLFEFKRNKEFFSKLLNEEIQIIKPELDTSLIPRPGKLRGKYILLFPGASRRNKMWSTKNFKEVAEFFLHNYSYDIVISGSNKESYLYTDIAPAGTEERFLNFFGNTLSSLAKLVSEAELLISNDTSAVHFAAATNTIFICISNGSYYGRFYPYPEDIFNKGYYLFPKNFIRGKENDINKVKAEEVTELLKRILK